MTKLINIKKIHDSKFLKFYELKYLNKANKEKTYEIATYNDILSPSDIGNKTSGVSIIAYKDDKMLLLKEYRMGVNKFVYNLCAGRLEAGETIEECARRELYEETGLKLVSIEKIFHPSYSSLSISDIAIQFVLAKVDGDIEDNTSDNEEIYAELYTKEEIAKLLETEYFSSPAQIAAYFFCKG